MELIVKEIISMVIVFMTELKFLIPSFIDLDLYHYVRKLMIVMLSSGDVPFVQKKFAKKCKSNMANTTIILCRDRQLLKS